MPTEHYRYSVTSKGWRFLAAVVGLAAVTIALNAAASPHIARADAVAASAAKPGPRGRIKHIVVIYQENHSFDETLGYFCLHPRRRCDGYVGPVRLADGTTVDMAKSPDPVPGAWHNVQAQTTAVNGGRMNGWAQVNGCHGKQIHHCLSYYTPKQIPNLTALTGKFVVSDRMFSMYNSPSWGGHIYVVAATQDNFTGDIPYKPGATDKKAVDGWGCDSHFVSAWKNPTTGATAPEPSCIPAPPGTLDPKRYPFNGPFKASPVKWVPTIFDRLDAAHISWKLYSGTKVWAICPTFAECAYGPQHKNVVGTHQIVSDASAGRLPAFSVLLPGSGTSQHNGSSMRAGDNWICEAVSAIERSHEWSSTAVFITYDDCGCFYDHVPPGTNPDGSKQGIRLPMVIVSPYAKQAYTDDHAATLASVLRFTEQTFGVKALSVNDKKAYNFSDAFNFAAKPTGPRVAMHSTPVSAASKRFIARHPEDPDDPT
jgi:phospholipase C